MNQVEEKSCRQRRLQTETKTDRKEVEKEIHGKLITVAPKEWPLVVKAWKSNPKRILRK